mmetsp:Transcript_12892/g.40507  ORF Transcript_12892/g.40507 Transcript_12892/m.40507 type:complete len:266 (-) Transcript_12892:2317-3114(-)
MPRLQPSRLRPKRVKAAHPSASTLMLLDDVAGTSPICIASSRERPSSCKACNLSEETEGPSSLGPASLLLLEPIGTSPAASDPAAVLLSPLALALALVELAPAASALRRAKKPPPPGLYRAGGAVSDGAGTADVAGCTADDGASVLPAPELASADPVGPDSLLAAPAACARRRTKKPPPPGVYLAAGALSDGVDDASVAGCTAEAASDEADVAAPLDAPAAVVDAAGAPDSLLAAAAAPSARRRAKNPPAPADQRLAVVVVPDAG